MRSFFQTRFHAPRSGLSLRIKRSSRYPSQSKTVYQREAFFNLPLNKQCGAYLKPKELSRGDDVCLSNVDCGRTGTSDHLPFASASRGRRLAKWASPTRQSVQIAAQARPSSPDLFPNIFVFARGLDDAAKWIPAERIHIRIRQ